MHEKRSHDRYAIELDIVLVEPASSPPASAVRSRVEARGSAARERRAEEARGSAARERRAEEPLASTPAERVCHSGKTRDLSLGGTFVHTSAPLRFGGEVTLQLAILSLKYEGEIPAVIRWKDEDGVGLAFRSLRARDVHALNQLFRESRGVVAG